MVDVQGSATTVRNSFVISNLLGLMASKLVEGDERDRLEKAYAAFAEEQRNLAVVGAVRIDGFENSERITRRRKLYDRVWFISSHYA